MSLASRIVDWFFESPAATDGSEPLEAGDRLAAAGRSGRRATSGAPATTWAPPLSPSGRTSRRKARRAVAVAERAVGWAGGAAAAAEPPARWAAPLVTGPGARGRWSPPVAADAAAPRGAPAPAVAPVAAASGAGLIDDPAPTAAVVGADLRAVMPVAAAVAGELRVRAGAPAAVVALWRPAAAEDGPGGTVPLGQARPAAGVQASRTVTPAGAAIPAARRLEDRLAGEGFGRVTACGRLAWVLLPAAPEAAAAAAARLVDGSEAPVVVAVCGPRPAALEPVLAGRDVAVAVLPQDADPDLRALALAALAAPCRSIHAPLQAGPPRWAALAGLARLRSLPPMRRHELAA